MVALSVAAVTPARASTTYLGQLAPAGLSGNCIDCTAAQDQSDPAAPTYAVPAGGGIITSWQVRGGTAAGSARLRIFRHAGGNYTLIGQSPVTPTAAASDAIHVTSIAVQPGDLLGSEVSSVPGAFDTASLQDVLRSFAGAHNAQPGDTLSAGSTTVAPGRRLNLLVGLESDADHDGRGDDTQECPRDLTLDVPCPDVSLTSRHFPAPGTAGRGLTYRLTVRNVHPSAAAGHVVVRAQLAAGLGVRSVRAALGGSCSTGHTGLTKTLKCVLGSLPPEKEWTIDVRARPRGPGFFRASADLSTGTTDPDPSDDRSVHFMRVNANRHGRCTNLFTGTAEADTLRGSRFGDRLVGAGGDDTLLGGDGADCLAGGTGADRLIGGAGDDRLDGGRGRDAIFGGSGNDVVEARDGLHETIDCGSGHDTVRADRSDTVRGCERVRRG